MVHNESNVIQREDEKIGESCRGSCLCGQVSLNIEHFARHVLACHCQQCRKQTGSCVHAASVENSKLSIEGEQHIKWYAASQRAKRGFCFHCGSLLFWKMNDSGYTSVMAGCLESPTSLDLVGHIFVSGKGDYYSIDDSAPQHDESGDLFSGAD